MSQQNDDILTRLARMEEKLDSYLFRQVSTEDRLVDHDKRLRQVENGTAKIFAVGAFGAAVAGILINLVPGFLS
jgi:hypothetical protein